MLFQVVFQVYFSLKFFEKELHHNCFPCILLTAFFITYINGCFCYSVNKILEDEISNNTSFQFRNYFSKWNKILVKQKVIGVFKKM